MEPTCPSPLGKRERTRLAIVNAAITLAAEKSLDATSIDDLMATAGMARGTFYNYFSDRDDLIRAVIHHIQLLLIREIVAFIPRDLSPAAIVACMVRGYLQLCQQERDIGKVMTRLSGFSPWVEGDEAIREGFSVINQSLQSLCGEQVSLTSARVYLQGMSNVTLYHLLSGKLCDVMAEELLQLTLRGLGIAEAEVLSALVIARHFTDSLV